MEAVSRHFTNKKSVITGWPARYGCLSYTHLLWFIRTTARFFLKRFRHSYFTSSTVTVCSYHVMYAFQSESTLCSYLNVKEPLGQSRREIWRLSDCNWTRTHNHLVDKGTLNHLAKPACLFKWLSIRFWTKWLRVRVQLQSLQVRFKESTRIFNFSWLLE